MCLREFYLLPLIVWLTSYWSLQCKMISSYLVFCVWRTAQPYSTGFVLDAWTTTRRVPSFCHCSKGDLVAVFQCPWELSASWDPRGTAELWELCDFQAKGFTLCSPGQVDVQLCGQVFAMGFGNPCSPKGEGAVLAVWVEVSRKPPRGHTSTQERCLFMGLSTWINEYIAAKYLRFIQHEKKDWCRQCSLLNLPGWWCLLALKWQGQGGGGVFVGEAS